MINNRQGGRRRGRGGTGPGRPPSGGPGPGNRQDNRQRGNAAQLLEKYKSMARDAQMQGDRVQTEYYLQYADHYYRLLNENRARFEEQRPARDESRDDFGYDEDEGEDEGMAADGGDDRNDRTDRNDRDARPQRNDRDARPQRDERPVRDARPPREAARAPREEARPPREDARPPREDRDFRGNGAGAGAGDRPRGRVRRERFEAADEGEERISLDVLPPAISAGVSAMPDVDAGEGGEAPKPRRRTRRVRDEGDEIAPAA